MVGATRSRVWRALSEPDEIVRWDARALAALDPTAGYPAPGRTLRWRYRLGSVPVVLRSEAVEVVPGARLREHLATGHLRLDETWSLASDESPDRTRLSLRLAGSNSVATVGGLLDRFDMRELASQLADSRLREVREYCEKEEL